MTMGFLLWAIRVLAFCLMLPFSSRSDASPQTFIVSIHNDLKPHSFTSVEVWYHSILDTIAPPSNSSSSSPPQNILYIYKTAFHGFSATLTTTQQTLQLSSHPAVLGIFPDPVYQIHTTRSPEFLGLTYHNDIIFPATFSNLKMVSDQGSNVVIGFMDTGICPKSISFRDEGLPPVPAHWKGECQGGKDFSKDFCNKKLVGVRYFFSGYRKSNAFIQARDTFNDTARDEEGHGTHTASTAAGRAVRNASLFGFASGEARGIAPKARIAVYRVCWKLGCLGSDILAGMDKAIEDGVNILSVSLGGPNDRYCYDPVALGAFTATERGIFVSAAAGNSGPEYGSVFNFAPWIATIGAGTIDRSFPAEMVLETGEVVKGVSLYIGESPPDELHPLFYSNNSSERLVSCIDEKAFEREDVRGKIVVCKRDMVTEGAEKGLMVQRLGGVGVVVANTGEYGEALRWDPHFIPGLSIPYMATKKLLAYLNSTQSPKAKLHFPCTQLGVKPAPVVTHFSSRGPNPESLYILKPDVIAPGRNILAAWPDNVSVTSLPEDKRMTQFNIMSGTSMSCPHVSGIAALLKGTHPDWNPAMIRSALMTTASLQDRFGSPLLTEFDYAEATIWDTGAGQVDPDKANDPGLVYDLRVEDYVEFLCASNYSQVDIGKIAKRKVRCSRGSKPWDLNYPAIVVYPDGNGNDAGSLNVVVRRSATNVAWTVPSRYNVRVRNPKGAMVTVVPPTLEFEREGETKSFEVRISAKKEGFWFEVGGLIWSDGTHNVSSPIVVGWGAPGI